MLFVSVPDSAVRNSGRPQILHGITAVVQWFDLLVSKKSALC